MSIVVAFCCAIGGWFVGCVSAYLLYRLTERAVPKTRKRKRKRRKTTWRQTVHYLTPGESYPDCDDDRPVEINPPRKLELVK